MAAVGEIRLGVPAAEYHKRELGVVSKSALDKIRRSPAHYMEWILGAEEEPTPAMRFGTAFHSACLEPRSFESAYRVEPDFGDCRKPANREKRDAWRENNRGAVMIDAADMSAIAGMLASVRNHPSARRILDEGASEVTLRWTDEATGLVCKSRADYWVKSKRLVVDVKTTEDASAKEFARSVYNFGYHRQDALYRAGFAACGEPVHHFAIIAVEKKPPYAVAVYTLDEEAVGVGYSEARADIETMALCLKSKRWPAYADGVQTLSLPRWAVG